jgi:hypothetical protein
MSSPRADAGIDDLLSFDDEPAYEEVRERSRAGWLIRNALLIAVATAVVVAGLRALDINISILLVASAAVALRLLGWAIAEVTPPPPPRSRARGTEDDGSYRWSGSDALRGAVRRWETRLDWAHSDAKRFSSNVLPVLAELTDERLRLRHGITRASDPSRARELLGEPFWRMLAEPDHRPPKARELAAHVQTLEQL